MKRFIPIFLITPALLLLLLISSTLSKYFYTDRPIISYARTSPVPSLPSQSTTAPTPLVSPSSTPLLISPTPTVIAATTTKTSAPDTCTNLPVLTYHHIEDLTLAAKEKRTSLSVSPQYFRQHLQYLKDHGYTTITPEQLSAFFDSNTPLPHKAVMITLDDGYDDNYTQALPLLQEFQSKAAIFMITGLINNPGYLSSDQLDQLKQSGIVTIGNHTWSHQALSIKDATKIATEIVQADQQLTDKGLNSAKVFAYPYGATSTAAVDSLKKVNYQIAFTTKSGRILCKNNRLLLPRIRPSNADLSKYGL